MQEAAFWLVKVTAHDDGWLAEGRAHQAIRLNDILTVPQFREGANVGPRLTVRAISSYGKDLPGLDPGLTGTLFLQGPGVGVLEDDIYLYKVES